MPRINTHLHLALMLSKKRNIADMVSFYLGNAYPDCWGVSVKQGLLYHYKKELASLCDLNGFLQNEELDDFNLGYLFHLWVDNRILEVDTGDISKSDCLLCDMEVIAPVIEQLRQCEFTGREYQAMQNVLALESEPMPLYLVSDDKKKRYNEILDKLADEFAAQFLR